MSSKEQKDIQDDKPDLSKQIESLQAEIDKLSEQLPETLEKTQAKMREEMEALVEQKQKAEAERKEAETKETEEEKKVPEKEEVDVEKLVAERLAEREKVLQEDIRKQIAEEQKRNSFVTSILDAYNVTDEKDREELKVGLEKMDIVSLELQHRDAQAKLEARRVATKPAPEADVGVDRIYARQRQTLVVPDPYKLTEEQKNLILKYGLQQLYPNIDFDAIHDKAIITPVSPESLARLKRIRKVEGYER